MTGFPGEREASDFLAYVNTLDNKEALGELIHLAKQHDPLIDAAVRENVPMHVMVGITGVISGMLTMLIRRYDETGPVERTDPEFGAAHSCQFMGRVLAASNYGVHLHWFNAHD